MSLLARFAFYPTLLYNVAMEKVSSRKWYNRVDDTVILGALPFRSMTKKLVEEENVGGVITLNEPYETKYFVNNKQEWSKAGVEQLVLPTTDLVAAPSQKDLLVGVNFINNFVDTPYSVYVHCKAGRTRSATVVACYLMKKHDWKPAEAIDFIKTKRPHIIIRNAQWDALKTFYSESVHTNEHR